METATAHRLLSGNTYFEVVNIGGRVKELYLKRPDKMSPIPQADGMVNAWEYDQGNGRRHVFSAEKGRPAPILHVRTFNPLDDYVGMSSMQAAAMAADSHNEATKWNKAVLENGASPSGALVTPTGVTLTDQEFSRLKSVLSEEMSGSRNARKPMLLEGGLQWVQMMLSQMDIDWLKGKENAAREIALVFNVPEQLVGVPGQQTYNNYREARLALYEDAVLPILYGFAESLTAWFQEWYNDLTLQLLVDEDSIPALELRQAQKWERVEKNTVLTINEKREMLGYERVDGGDELFVTATQLPLSMAGISIDQAGAVQKAYELAYGKK